MWDENGYMDRKKGCGFCLILLLIFLFVSMFITILEGICSNYNTEKNYTVTVTDKAVKDDKYLIFTEDEEGNSKTYEIEDTSLRHRWNSSDMYGKIKVGQTYNISTIGWRVEYLSWYENIISAEKIE